jgi:hypothetical protein
MGNRKPGDGVNTPWVIMNAYRIGDRKPVGSRRPAKLNPLDNGKPYRRAIGYSYILAIRTSNSVGDREILPLGQSGSNTPRESGKSYSLGDGILIPLVNRKVIGDRITEALSIGMSFHSVIGKSYAMADHESVPTG